MEDIYRVRANYPMAMGGFCIDGTIQDLPVLIRGLLADPENFVLSISEGPIPFEDNSMLDYQPVTMAELEDWAKEEAGK